MEVLHIVITGIGGDRSAIFKQITNAATSNVIDVEHPQPRAIGEARFLTFRIVLEAITHIRNCGTAVKVALNEAGPKPSTDQSQSLTSASMNVRC